MRGTEFTEHALARRERFFAHWCDTNWRRWRRLRGTLLQVSMRACDSHKRKRRTTKQRVKSSKNHTVE